MSALKHIDFEVPGFGEFAAPPADQPAYTDRVAALGPIAYWRLGETEGPTAFDETANGINGGYSGSVTFNASGLLAFGQLGTARFNGSDAYIDINSHPLINSGGPYATKTCIVWFSADLTTPRQVIYEQGGRNRGLAIYVDAGSVYVGVWHSSSDAYLSVAASGSDVHMAALVYGRTTGLVEGYLDGVRFAQALSEPTIDGHDSSIGIGAVAGRMKFHDGDEPFTLEAPFEGRIGEVALFNTAFDEATIHSLYLSGVGR